MLSKHNFERLLGPLQDILIEYEQKPERKSNLVLDPDMLREKELDKQISLQDLIRTCCDHLL